MNRGFECLPESMFKITKIHWINHYQTQVSTLCTDTFTSFPFN
jgi:hypothetical protein